MGTERATLRYSLTVHFRLLAAAIDPVTDVIHVTNALQRSSNRRDRWAGRKITATTDSCTQLKKRKIVLVGGLMNLPN